MTEEYGLLELELINNGSAYAVINASRKATEIDIPPSYNNLPIIKIEKYAFGRCEQLTCLKIPYNVIEIDCKIFFHIDFKASEYACNEISCLDWSELKTLEVHPDNPIYRSEGNCIIKRKENSVYFGSANSVIPEGITTIEPSAFHGCHRLQNIIIPQSVKTIGEKAFYSCRNLQSITLHDNLEYIGYEAFYACRPVNITIPSTVQHIGKSAFQACNNLVIFTGLKEPLEGWEEGWNDKCPVIYGHANGELAFTLINNETAYEVSRGTTGDIDITIPSIYNNLPVTSIADYGFKDYHTLRKITIPSSVTSIGIQAFAGCHRLQNGPFTEGLINIGYKAFNDCASLSTIDIPSTVANIGGGAFIGCVTLEKINVVEGNVTYKSEGNCLIHISNNSIILGCHTSNIPSYATSIADNAFKGCINLIKITIPENIASIGCYAFDGCSNLEIITFYADSYPLSIGEHAFSYCRNLVKINIPEGIKYIAERTFEGCSSFTGFTIPNSVTSIETRAFSWCSKLGSINIPSGVTNIESLAFNNCPNLVNVFIPFSVVSMSFRVFDGHDKQTFFIEWPFKPPGWDDKWCCDSKNIKWGEDFW